MLKKMISLFILVLVLVFLGGCGNDSLLEVRIIEDHQALGLEIPQFPRIDWNFGVDGFLIEVLNGSTGEVEQTIEFSDYKRFGSLEVNGNYHILRTWQMDEEYQSFISEFLIFDKNFNLVESFRIDQNSVAYSKSIGSNPQLSLNETGDWLIYLWESASDFAGPSHIYTYNFNNHELISVTEVESLFNSLYLIESSYKLAFTVTHGFGGDWFKDVEFRFIDLETFEEEIVFQIEDISHPQVSAVGKFLLADIIANNGVREAVLIHSQTNEVSRIPFGYEDSLHGNPDLTMDGELMFIFQHEFRGRELSDIVSWIRLHDTNNGEVVFEYQLINENTLAIGEVVVDIEFLNIDEDIYLIRAIIFEEEVTGSGYEIVFEIVDIRFEYIVIEIVRD